jgi:hypothetical protein
LQESHPAVSAPPRCDTSIEEIIFDPECRRGTGGLARHHLILPVLVFHTYITGILQSLIKRIFLPMVKWNQISFSLPTSFFKGSFPNRMNFYNSCTGLAGIILICPAGIARPPPAQDALPEL